MLSVEFDNSCLSSCFSYGHSPSFWYQYKWNITLHYLWRYLIYSKLIFVVVVIFYQIYPLIKIIILVLWFSNQIRAYSYIPVIVEGLFVIQNYLPISVVSFWAWLWRENLYLKTQFISVVFYRVLVLYFLFI